MMLFCGAGTYEPLQRVDNADSLGKFKIKYLMFADDPALHNKLNFGPILGTTKKQSGISEHYFGIDQVSNFIHMANLILVTILESYSQNSLNAKTFEELAYCSIENGFYCSVIEKKGIRLLHCALRAVEPDTDILFPQRQNEGVDFFIKFKNEKKVLAVSMKSAINHKKLISRKMSLNAEKNAHLVNAIIAFDTFDNVSVYCIHKTDFDSDTFFWSLCSNSATAKKSKKSKNTTLVTAFAGVIQWTTGTPCVCNAKVKGRWKYYKQCLTCDFTINVEEARKLYLLMVSKVP
jgi:hypothetical protein